MISITTLEELLKNKLPRELIRIIYYESIRKDEKHLQEIRNNDNAHYEELNSDFVSPDQYYITKKKKYEDGALFYMNDVFYYNGKIYQSMSSAINDKFICLEVLKDPKQMPKKRIKKINK